MMAAMLQNHVPAALLLALVASCASPEILEVLPRGDTYIDEMAPARNFDSVGQLEIGDSRDWEHSSARVLLDFDLAALPYDPCQIRRVTLLAYQDGASPPFGHVACDVHRCLDPWRADTVTWSSEVGFDERIWATAMVEEANLQEWVEWDVTALVLAELAGEVPARGWMVKAAQEGRAPARRARFQDGKRVVSRDKPVRLLVSLWPLLLQAERAPEHRTLAAYITGLVPGQEVLLFLSTGGEGETYLPHLDLRLGLADPKPLTRGTADGDGEAVLEARAPQGTAGGDLWLQAISGDLRSNVVRLVGEPRRP